MSATPDPLIAGTSPAGRSYRLWIRRGEAGASLALALEVTGPDAAPGRSEAPVPAIGSAPHVRQCGLVGAPADEVAVFGVAPGATEAIEILPRRVSGGRVVVPLARIPGRDAVAFGVVAAAADLPGRLVVEGAGQLVVPLGGLPAHRPRRLAGLIELGSPVPETPQPAAAPHGGRRRWAFVAALGAAVAIAAAIGGFAVLPRVEEEITSAGSLPAPFPPDEYWWADDVITSRCSPPRTSGPGTEGATQRPAGDPAPILPSAAPAPLTARQRAEVRAAIAVVAAEYVRSPGQEYVFDDSDPTPVSVRSLLAEYAMVMADGPCAGLAGELRLARTGRRAYLHWKRQLEADLRRLEQGEP